MIWRIEKLWQSDTGICLYSEVMDTYMVLSRMARNTVRRLGGTNLTLWGQVRRSLGMCGEALHALQRRSSGRDMIEGNLLARATG